MSLLLEFSKVAILASPAVCLGGVAGAEQVGGVEKCLVVLAVGKGVVKSCVG